MKADAPQTPSRAAVRAAFEAARPARAPGPQAEAEALRRAYLGLLKLCLCDLCGTTTMSVERGPDGHAVYRELGDGWLKLRALGMDWPRQGLTMVGLSRLDDLQWCVESVVRDGVEGDLIEAGCWRGGASILMRATLDSLGAHERTLWVADSFEGFPEPAGEEDQEDLAALHFLAVPLEEVEENFARFGCEEGVRFVPGFFEETMPSLASRTWSIVRLDGDTYDATRLALECLYPGLSVGGHLIIDDYSVLEECRRAVDDFRRERGIDEPLEKVDWTCVRWRREREGDEAEPPPPAAAPAASARGGPRRVARPRKARIPSTDEVELARELAAVRERLEVAELGAARAARARLRRLGGRLRRRLHRGP